MRLHIAIAAVAVAVLAASCTAGAGRPAASPAPAPPDPALLKIATAFNQDYDGGKYASVYARWDARSQAIISEADYIRRHEDCPGALNHPEQGCSSSGAALSPRGPAGVLSD